MLNTAKSAETSTNTTIDYAHYISRAHMIRSHEAHAAIRSLVNAMTRLLPRKGRVSGASTRVALSPAE